MMTERLKGRHLVLFGIGHTNAHVLRMWKMNALPDTDLTCISDFSIASYSGMLPAVLAGQVPPERMQIDLVRLCNHSGARLVTNPVTGIDHSSREVMFADRPPIPFDVMSIGVGSTASTEDVDIDSDGFVMIKPMQSFLQRLTLAVSRHLNGSDRDVIRVSVVGSGVAGIEITCCLPRLIREQSGRRVEVSLVTRSEVILPALEPKTRQLIEASLQERDVKILTKRSVTEVSGDRLSFADGESIESDIVIWATNASPPPILSSLGLKLDDRGFIETDHTLQSSLAGVFAVGDTGTIVREGLPKAGVYAVRQGPVLWENIQRSLRGSALERYKPQRSFLKLINLGDGTAVGQWKSMAFSGRLAMRLKERIDGRFMDMFQVGQMPSMTDSSMPDEMQCRGCGCKLGADVLESAIASDAHGDLDDAAEIGGDSDSKLLASTDFFTSPFEDAYLSGRVAALHSASDIVASGARATEALANVVLPEGDRQSQRRTLHDFSAGARLEFDAMGAAIVGGHTIVGPRMEVGFTVIGKQLGDAVLRKANLRVGDRLYVTKAIGIGVLLAAHMRSQCPAGHYESLLEAMLHRQHSLAQVALSVGLDAGTDITGFGLAGHLIEMLNASELSATVELNTVPCLPGAIDQVEQGVESSLAPDNLTFERSVDATGKTRATAPYKLLFDPQTCGGMLLGVAEHLEGSFVQAIKNAGQPPPVRIGVVEEASSGKCLRVR
ncbi:MAG: selenide, water dikinase SelD [Rubripirellula sp.]